MKADIQICFITRTVIDLTDYGHEENVTWDDLSKYDKTEIKQDLIDQYYSQIELDVDIISNGK